MKHSLLLLPALMLLSAAASAQPYEVSPTPAETIPPELRVGPVVTPDAPVEEPVEEPPAPVKMPAVIYISPALPPYKAPAPEAEVAPSASLFGAWTDLTLHFGGRNITPNLDKVAGVASSDSIGGGFASLQLGRSFEPASPWTPDQLRTGLAFSGVHASEFSLGSEATIDTFRVSLRQQALWQVYDALYATVAGELGGTRGDATLNLDGVDLTQDKVWGVHADLLAGLEARWKFESFVGGLWFETGPALETELTFDRLARKGAPSVNLGSFDASGWRNGGGLFVGFSN
jgi:hypothetical protein